ncbi:FixH family protein [Mesonia aestuariivivens]|uniref:FixH family protein n=1 Tax=Mesonia aestuariivivens TaxID=2796128 RepID=A0ABS6VZ60_9FLAO|nr:FixH family protein [Mesonia aestuariivivens]MBW2960882.1 FixH family protein [Mesonia aestuariivivens]
MKNIIFWLAAMLFAVTLSCTIDKTDYEAELSPTVTEDYIFEDALSFNTGDYKISVESLNGTFNKGYNEIRLQLTVTETNENLAGAEVTLLPIFSSDDVATSCPHSYNLVYDEAENAYVGYAVFTSESTSLESWELYFSLTANNQIHQVNQQISVEEQLNKNLNITSFTGADNQEYVIALVAPRKPKVAENELIAGIYKYNNPTTPAGDFPDPSQFSYSVVEDYTLLIDPRMPEPSMGNHSTPNNQDLTQGSDGFYHGVVNYTMTGAWTLNFIMLNSEDEVVKGTEVSTAFTPGIEGEKGELYIDTLF